MNRSGPLALALMALLVASAPRDAAAVQDRPTLVEPSELAGRRELINRPIAVEDRVRLFLRHGGGDYDEILLKRTPIVFRLPPALRPSHAPDAQNLRVEGVLREAGGSLFVDVTAFTPLPDDLERLNRGVASLGPGDAKRRHDWARWALRRAEELDDPALAERARAIETEAFRIEADRSGDDPGPLLAMARRARERGVPEPEPSALAHRAFRLSLATVQDAAPAERLADEIAAFFPAARQPQAADLANWTAPYDADPASTYRRASDSVRAALDRRLYADALRKALELRAAAQPGEALALAERAAKELPDHPEVAEAIRGRGLRDRTEDVGSLTRREVTDLARVYERDEHQPEKARELVRRWLHAQRVERLSAKDADGRVSLARLYDEMLGDRDTAAELLQEALALDPQLDEAEQALRRYGYRKVGETWVASRDRGDDTPEAAPEAAGRRADPLLDLTRDEVRSRLGAPERIARSGTQDGIVEQWIYGTSTRTTQYLNFRLDPGRREFVVVAHYSVR